MNHTTELLDADELMQLALEATHRAQNGDAIEYLKRLLALRPDSAAAHYLLGAQQAQIGMPDRAIASMTQALALRPGIDAARFQLGLLLLNAGRLPDAESTWQPLDALGEHHPFALFKTGLLHVAREAFAEGVLWLRRGLEATPVNEFLNADMQRLLDDAQTRLDAVSASAPPPESPASPQTEDVPSMFLNAYTRKVH